MNKYLLLLVPLALFAQIQIDTVVRLPTDDMGQAFFTPELNKLYLTGSDRYFVLDCSTYELKAEIAVRTGYSHFSWNPSRHKLYTTGNPYLDSTLVIDAAADSVIGSLKVCREFHTDVYLSDVDRLYKPAVDTLYEFDCATDTVVRRLMPGEHSTCASWDSVGKKLYIGEGSRKKLYVYDYLADSCVKVVDVSAVSAVMPDALVFNYGCHKAYVSSFQSEPWDANVGIIDTERDTLIGVLPVRMWDGLYGHVAVDELDGKVYLADDDANPKSPDTLWVVDCATDSVLKKVEYEHRGYGAAPVRWVPWSNRLYLVSRDFDSSSVVVLDCSTDSIIARLRLGDWVPQDIQLDPVHERIFVIGVNHTDVYVLRDTGYAAVETPKAEVRTASPMPTFVRGVLCLSEATSRKLQASSLLDIGGRKVMDLKPGANDVSRISPGVYFVREAQAQTQVQAVRKVVVTRQLLDMGKDQARLKVVVK